jgi:hypothetical protein
LVKHALHCTDDRGAHEFDTPSKQHSLPKVQLSDIIWPLQLNVPGGGVPPHPGPQHERSQLHTMTPFTQDIVVVCGEHSPHSPQEFGSMLVQAASAPASPASSAALPVPLFGCE